MPIILLTDPPKNVRPKGGIRADVAWKLFLPDHMGDLPEFTKGRTEPLTHWLWSELSRKLGFLKRGPEDRVYILTPPLTNEAREFIIRVCSLWSNEVFAVSGSEDDYDTDAIGENLWIPPVVNVRRSPEKNTALAKMEMESPEGRETFYSPVLGETRSFIRSYTINRGETYARYHSHTSREELYLVLGGSGTIRIAGHAVKVYEGDLISKPTGPDISTQFLADSGESMTVLDIEIWPDREKRSKDLVSYPDHSEIDLFGEGWNIMIPSDALQDTRDAMEHYSTGYRRKLDGTWEPEEIPGFKKREK